MSNQHSSHSGVAFAAAALVFLFAASAQPAEWPVWPEAEDAGFSARQIAEARSLWEALDDSSRAAFFAVYKGKVLAAFGDSSREYQCPTVRSTLMSALYGAYLQSGEIDLEKTLEEVGINDLPPLTRSERQATIAQLLQARSGVYHQAACESQTMRNTRPARGSHPPGKFWYYNNWDVNALGTILFRETGRGVFEAFDEKIARPLGMEDFRVEDCNYRWQLIYSLHPCYWFRMSVRDRARLGQLYLQKGRWGDRQILPEDWVSESTRKVSHAHRPGLGFGYMWWTLEPEFFASVQVDPRLHHLRGFAANDFAGQLILVLPDAEMVLVLGSEAGAENRFRMADAFPMMERIVTAREIVDLVAFKLRVARRGEGGSLRLTTKVRNDGAASRPSTIDFYLSPERRALDSVRWIGSADLAGLAAGSKETVRTRVSLPDDLEPGKYFLVAVADSSKANYDLRRDNNLAVAAKPVHVR